MAYIQHHAKCRKSHVIPYKIKNKTKHHSLHFYSVVLDVLARALRQQKKSKRTQ